MPWPYRLNKSGKSRKREHAISLVHRYWEYESPFPDYSSLSKDLVERDIFGDLRIPYGDGLEDLHRDIQAYEADWTPRASDDGIHFCTDPSVNLSFPEYDAFILFCMIRRFRPNRVVELGSGMSTRVIVEGLAAEDTITQVVAVDKYVTDATAKRLSALGVEFRRQDIVEIDLAIIDSLGSGDILFIDSSHVLKNFGDVEYEYMKLLPRLQPGVVVHVHDVFLPYNYPLNWIVDWRCVLTEQQVLGAYLHDNSKVRILSANYFNCRNGVGLPKAMNDPDGGSFWFQIKS